MPAVSKGRCLANNPEAGRNGTDCLHLTPPRHLLRQSLGEVVIVTEALRANTLKALALPPVYRLFKPFTRGSAIVFVLHRFEDTHNGVQGHSPALLDEALTFLRREGFNFVSLAALIKSARGETPPLERAVCFTMDDGFLDQATIAAPIFQKHNCPVTGFLITGFIDGQLWPWDDQVRYLFTSTAKPKLAVDLGSRVLQFDLTQRSRLEAARAFRELCKALPEDQLLDAVNALADACGVSLPVTPPVAYQPMTWDTLRKLEQQGFTFGSHGVSHRILARMTTERVKAEMHESWARLTTELSNPLPVYCFSTGRRHREFTDRELALLQGTPYQAAVSTDPGYVEYVPRSHAVAPLVLDRFTFPEDKTALIQYCSGIEHMKTWLRTTPFSTVHNRFGGKSGLVRYGSYQAQHWLGQFRELKRIDWDRITRLVFVCKGNICRSAFAEGVARRAGLNTVSYGVDTRGGDPAEPRAVAMAREHGIDLERHITQRTDDYTARPGDLIVAMEPDHLRLLNAASAPNNGAQQTLLGLWQAMPSPYIHDPYAASDEYFRRCFAGIIEAVEGVRTRLSPSAAMLGQQTQEAHS